MYLFKANGLGKKIITTPEFKLYLMHDEEQKWYHKNGC